MSIRNPRMIICELFPVVHMGSCSFKVTVHSDVSNSGLGVIVVFGGVRFVVFEVIVVGEDEAVYPIQEFDLIFVIEITLDTHDRKI